VVLAEFLTPGLVHHVMDTVVHKLNRFSQNLLCFFRLGVLLGS